MILVQNLLQLLNGNKLLVAVCFFLVSCSTVKPMPHKGNTQIVKGSVPTKVSKRDTLEQPKGAIDKEHLDRSTGIGKIDTVQWKDVSKDKTPIKESGKVGQSGSKNNFKPIYNIKLLIPLNSDDISDPGISRFTYFYAGTLLALEELKQEGIRLKVDVIDTDENNFKVEDNLNKIADSNTDLIVGPFDRDGLKALLEVCKEKDIILVSPWYTSSKLTTQNPSYIQMNPNLKEHFLKLVKHSVKTYQPKEVTILARGSKDQPWIDFFESEAQKITSVKDFFNVYNVNTDSLKLGPTAFFNMFKSQNIKAVILPNYSYSDESYIYSCLRRLAAEKGTKSFSVMGMPILYDSDKIEFDFYRSLQMKLVMADYVDEDYGKIREFRRKFLDTYGEIPTVEAVKGYDLTIFLGKNIWKHGRNFQQYVEYEPSSYLQSIYDIQKAVSDDASENQDDGYFDYYENKHLDIIEFKGNKWIRL